MPNTRTYLNPPTVINFNIHEMWHYLVVSTVLLHIHFLYRYKGLYNSFNTFSKECINLIFYLFIKKKELLIVKMIILLRHAYNVTHFVSIAQMTPCRIVYGTEWICQSNTTDFQPNMEHVPFSISMFHIQLNFVFLCSRICHLTKIRIKWKIKNSFI